MEITVQVELYTGSHKETVDIKIEKSHILELAEKIAQEVYYCNSCIAKNITITNTLNDC